MPNDTLVPVRINGGLRDVPARLTVAELLGHLDLHPRMVVVERNGEILRRDALDATPVDAGDSLELVHFVGGG
jgi:thiamine biosynthesis protein ThiS